MGVRENEVVHSYMYELASSLGSYLYGRKMYGTMVYWETAHTIPGQPDFVLEWARQWREAEKVVYSRTACVPRRPAARRQTDRRRRSG